MAGRGTRLPSKTRSLFSRSAAWHSHSSPTKFPRFSTPRNLSPTIFARFSCEVGFRHPGIRVPRYLRGFRGIRVPRYLRWFRHPGIRVPRYLRGSLVRFWTHRNSSPTIFARFSMPRNSSPTIFARVSTSRNSSPMIFARFSRNSSPTIFAMVSTSQNSSPTILARVSTSRNSSPTIFARFSRNSSPTIFARFSTRKDKNIPVSSRARKSVTMLFAVFSSAQMSVTMLFAVFSCTQMSVTMLFAVFSSAQMSVTMLFAVFSCAQGVRGVLRLYYKKSTFQPRKLRVSAAYYVCTTKVDFPATEAPGASVCATTLDFPATEAPGVPGVLRLYYKSRLSSHGSSGCPRRTTSVLQKSTFQPRKLRGRPWRTTFVRQNSIFQPRKSPAYYVCTTQVEKNTQQHYGFSTATTRKPAEGLRLHVKKRKNTTVLAPRQRRNPQRGYVCMSGNAKTRRFWHCANAETRRGCPRARKKSTKHDGFSTATRRSAAEGCPRKSRNVKKTTVLAPRPR